MRVPVLCYHRIEPPPASAPHDANFVSPALFGEHLSMLSSFGCTGITVRDLAAWQRGECALPKRAIAITFDDAYESVVNAGVPQLTAYGWSASVFVVTSCIGGTNRWDTRAPQSSLLDAQALRNLIVAGFEIGSHSRSHRRIRGLSDDEAHAELIGSRTDLETAIHGPVESFAFPFGTHDRVALDRVRKAGYRAACTLKRWSNGRGGNPLRLGRMSVGGPLSARRLAAKLLKMQLMPAFA